MNEQDLGSPLKSYSKIKHLWSQTLTSHKTTALCLIGLFIHSVKLQTNLHKRQLEMSGSNHLIFSNNLTKQVGYRLTIHIKKLQVLPNAEHQHNS